MQNLHTIAFYNCENLFDTFDDPKTLDNDFTPTGFKKWDIPKYENKIGKLSMAIGKIGLNKTKQPPTLIGLAEVENKSVIKDLLNSQYFKDYRYDFVHFDSNDERGIDVALLYNTDFFHVTHAEPIHPPVLDNNSGRDRTRDILYVKGNLNDKEIHLFVLHLPSQRDESFNQKKREAITEKIRLKINQIFENNQNPFIMVLGDLNDQPTAKIFKRNLRTIDKPWFDNKYNLYNPMELLSLQKKYSNHHGKKGLNFDQMLFSSAFFDTYQKPNLLSAKVFNPYFLQEWKRQYKGQPFRTFVGRKYLGGYSDHFPVYAILKF